jgi:hypothetical protein
VIRRAGIALALVAAAVAPAAAQDDAIEPDRPSVADSARTVPPGAVQLETGVEYARTQRAGAPTERRAHVEALARAGVADRVEAQVGWGPLVHLRGPDDETGIGDVWLALKIRALDPPSASAWPTLGLLPFVKLPVADEPIGSARPDFGASALASFDLGRGIGLDVNAGLTAVGQTRPTGFLLQALASAAVSFEVLDAVPFVELFHASRDDRERRGRTGFDVGLVYRLTPRVALDAAFETSLVGDGPDWAVRAGLSARFGR